MPVKFKRKIGFTGGHIKEIVDVRMRSPIFCPRCRVHPQKEDIDAFNRHIRCQTPLILFQSDLIGKEV